MFKRVRRRIDKSEKEHKLGLTPEVKEELGLDVDDTETSMSESGSESSGSERPSRKRKRLLKDVGGSSDAGDSDSRGGASEGEEEENSDPNEGDVEGDMGAEGGPTIDSTLKDPIFFVSDDQQACAVCPGRHLKNKHMAELHMGATVSLKYNTRISQGSSYSDYSTIYADLQDLSRQLSASRPGLTTSAPILLLTLCVSWTQLNRISEEPVVTNRPRRRNER